MGRLIRMSGELPQLRRPWLVAALEGFVDAGAAAATAATFLRLGWKSEVSATFDVDELIDFRARRPTVVVESGTLQRVAWPDIELLAATIDGPRDALLLLGVEPDVRWGAFCGEVVEVCREAGVEQMIGLGAYAAPAPHTRPIRVRHTANLAATTDRSFAQFPGVPRYTGPSGIVRILQGALGEAGIPAVSLLAEVPHYLAALPSPAGALALVRALAALFQTEVDIAELEAAATLHREQVDAALAPHQEAADMISALEQQYDLGSDGGLRAGEDLAAEIERFLRSQSE